jgi:glycosyltransferase involved in cell wall biosynthesis
MKPHYQAQILQAWDKGSHRFWEQGIKDHSGLHTHSLYMPGKYWKWRMQASAIYFAEQLNAAEWTADFILCTDLCQVPLLKGLLNEKWSGVPVYLYFHENQISYPWSEEDEDPGLARDRHYMFMNYSSALAADKILFNSEYHHNSFIGSLKPFLNVYPDFKGLNNISFLENKSSVIPLGFNWKEYAQHRNPGRGSEALENEGPILLWNHRWEADKNPALFFKSLLQLADEGLAFQVIALGEDFRLKSQEFHEFKQRFPQRVLHSGFLKDKASYLEWVAKADLLPVCSRHDFFGISVLEAIYLGVEPLLPFEMAYPEHFPEGLNMPESDFFYARENFDDDTFRESLRRRIIEFNSDTGNLLQSRNEHMGLIQSHLERNYDWSVLAKQYQALFSVR